MNNDAFPRGLFFLAGAASGFALGIYLHSEKGSALREQNEQSRSRIEAMIVRLKGLEQAS